jgi:phosphoglycolate phosphatase
MSEYIFKQTETLIQNRTIDHPFILGINGVDLSGKTTFTNNLTSWLKSQGYHTQVVHLDDFHNPSTKRRQGTDPIAAYWQNAFNLHQLETEILAPITQKGCLDKELLLLDLESDRFINRRSYHVKPDSIVLLEGVLLFREPIDRYLTARLFIDVNFDEVLRRASLRDVPRFGQDILNTYQTKYIPIQKKYLADYKPQEKADLIIDNNNPQQPRLTGDKL